MSAIDLPGYGIETEPPMDPEVPCRICGDDHVLLDGDGKCDSCRPTEDETCEDYEARVRKIRSHCSCTVRSDFGGVFASGNCTVHGFAWHTRWSR